MPRASAADAAKTAQRILKTATDLFASRGFASVSLEDVASSAGVTRGAVYHHFRNKTGLFAAALGELQREVSAQVAKQAQAAGVDAAEQLRAGSHAFLDAVTAAPVVRVLLVDGPAVLGWQRWRQIDAENSAVHLRDALAAVGEAAVSVDAMTAQLSGAMNEAALWIAQHEDPKQASNLAHAALDRLLAVVIGSPA